MPQVRPNPRVIICTLLCTQLKPDYRRRTKHAVDGIFGNHFTSDNLDHVPEKHTHIQTDLDLELDRRVSIESNIGRLEMTDEWSTSYSVYCAYSSTKPGERVVTCGQRNTDIVAYTFSPDLRNDVTAINDQEVEG